MSEKKKLVFSGIQPTGNIHIGNYLGAVKNWVAQQEEYDNIFCIVNLHAITVPQDKKVLKKKTLELAGLLLAAGIDPERSSLFVQSDVPAHSELAWILNCYTPMGWMQRMTQFKEKSVKQKDEVTVGLFDYPALMAADILLYNANGVPVGNDQKQHVELTRDIAQRFNHMYGETFVIPEPIIPKAGARIMGLDDPTKKMSKSEDAKGHAIGLLDTPAEIRKKFKRATTDSERLIAFDENRAAMFNLLTIFQVFTGKSKSDIAAHFDGKGYGDLKNDIAEAVIESLRPLHEKYQQITSEKGYIESVLARGAEQVRPIAQRTIRKVRRKIGLE
ncbi:MAG: tryptophan--tRNA ligase [Calditrichaeota bacterium]|jgi:tryptophanyl-tRNA synthetase|nr:tryptophan--tRNA ligase [Calditrichota bacterium]MBT7790015.1 tryptophan--tRNA ligase [Calditrichota bacterium]